MSTRIRKRRRLAQLNITRTSVVDHPANGTQVGGEGWLVMKADGSGLPPALEAAVRAAAEDVCRPRPESTTTSTKAAPVTSTTITKSTVFAKIEKAGEALRRTPEGAALTREQAIDRVAELQPDLAQEYRLAAVDEPVTRAAAPSALGSAALERLERLVETIAKARGIPKHSAYDEALARPEGRALAATYYAVSGEVAKARDLLRR